MNGKQLSYPYGSRLGEARCFRLNGTLTDVRNAVELQAHVRQKTDANTLTFFEENRRVVGLCENRRRQWHGMMHMR